MIGAAQLTQLRGALLPTLPDTATPLTPGTPQQQAGGGWSSTDTAGTPFPCRLQPITREPVEGLTTVEMQSRARYWFFYPVFYPGTSTPIRIGAQNRVRIGTLTYEITAVLDPGADTLLNRALVWRDSEVLPP